jgi:hypothetical protein
MFDLVVVEGIKLQRIEYAGQPVLTLPMIDKAHRRPQGTAGRTFRKFRDRLILGEDYFEVRNAEWSSLIRRNTSDQTPSASDQDSAWGGYRGTMIFMTMSGYLMLVKTFTDDLSWKVQRVLVKTYFQANQCVLELKDELIQLQRRLIAALTKKPARKMTAEAKAIIAEMKSRGLQTY